MKILAAATRDSFIVEMSEIEIIRAAGFSCSYDSEWAKKNGGQQVKVGTVIAVDAAYSFHSRISSKQQEAKNAAGVLRALAEMLENGLPDVVAPPPVTAPQQEGGEA